MRWTALLRTSTLPGALLGLFLLLSPGSGQAQSKTVVHFWVAWDPQQADAIAAKKEIAAYEQAHPDVTIDVQNITYDALHDKLITAVAGGEGPDISWGLPEWFGELYRMGALMDLSGFEQHWAARPEIYPNVLKALTIHGKLMALPHYLGIRALLSHADMLKAAGIAAPPKSWAELIADSKVIHQKLGKPGFGIAGTGVRAPQELIMYLAQNDLAVARPTRDGKYRNTWNDDKAQLARAAQVFAFYHDLQASGAISPDASGWGWEEEDTDFALGRYAMAIDGPWMESREAQNPKEMADVEITAPPTIHTPATFFEINPFYVFKASADKQATLDFAAFVTGREFQQAVHPQNSPRMDVHSDNKWGRDFMTLASSGVVFPPVPLAGITRDMEDAIGRVLLRHETPQSVARWLGQAINRDLRQSGELGSAS